MPDSNAPPNKRQKVSDKNRLPPLPIVDSNGVETYVEVKPSKIEGQGLFAKIDIPKKTVFCFYSGTADTPAPPIDPSLPESGRGIRGYSLSEDAHTPGQVNLVSGHFANSIYKTGIRPHAEFRSKLLENDPYGRRWRCVLKSTRFIPQGTEILLNYGSEFKFK